MRGRGERTFDEVFEEWKLKDACALDAARG